MAVADVGGEVGGVEEGDVGAHRGGNFSFVFGVSELVLKADVFEGSIVGAIGDGLHFINII